MSKVLAAVLSANQKYAARFGDKANLAMRLARRIAILTCMDARLVPSQFAGLVEGDAHVIRNAGGRANDDAIRSLLISHKLLGTNEWFVIHHTDCGALTLNKEKIRELLSGNLEAATADGLGGKDNGNGPVSQGRELAEWPAVRDHQQTVAADVERIRKHPLVPKDIAIYGYVFDVKTGKLNKVAGAQRIVNAASVG